MVVSRTALVSQLAEETDSKPVQCEFESHQGHQHRVRRDLSGSAPIRHIDHARPHRDGGPTSVVNGRGTCERCNYHKEAPGWDFTITGGSAPHITVAKIETRVRVDVDAMRCPAA